MSPNVFLTRISIAMQPSHYVRTPVRSHVTLRTSVRLKGHPPRPHPYVHQSASLPAPAAAFLMQAGVERVTQLRAPRCHHMRDKLLNHDPGNLTRTWSSACSFAGYCLMDSTNVSIVCSAAPGSKHVCRVDSAIHTSSEGLQRVLGPEPHGLGGD